MLLNLELQQKNIKVNFWLGWGKITTEGEDSPRTAVIEFSSSDEAQTFFYSKEYQEAHSILTGVVIRHHQIIERT